MIVLDYNPKTTHSPLIGAKLRFVKGELSFTKNGNVSTYIMIKGRTYVFQEYVPEWIKANMEEAMAALKSHDSEVKYIFDNKERIIRNGVRMVDIVQFNEALRQGQVYVKKIDG